LLVAFGGDPLFCPPSGKKPSLPVYKNEALQMTCFLVLVSNSALQLELLF
jgi:hypothetical protein